MELSKEKLDELIREEWTLGNYLFDQEEKCFFADTEVVLGIVKVEENSYKLADLYFFDGYEVGLDEAELEFYAGPEENAVQEAVVSFNRKAGEFMSYPIIYTNVSCEVLENEE